MHHPYQCLATSRPGSSGPQYLLTASGHKLFSAGIEDGIIISRWPKTDGNDVEVETKTTQIPEETSTEPPAKKRRLSTSNGHEASPNIIKLTVTHSQQHVVVVTAEDKCVRVFSISDEGELSQLSARAMPKRPCAIAFTPDDENILVADKFGDVYSLPLLPDPDQEAEFVAAQKAAAEAKAFVPAATELTVHSSANRRALEMQKQQAKDNPSGKTKDPLAFAHTLLLGHVSMLTDMLVATLRPSEEDVNPRTYILTADRDEHIRISRGPPQAYVIEGFCLGHHEFVNKLCMVEPGLLVSGGGDHEILVWDWLQQKAVNRIDVLDAVQRARLHIQETGDDTEEGDAAMKEEPEEIEKEIKITVSGLWLFADASLETEPQLLIICEGVPAILYIPVAALRNEEARDEISFLPLDGNPLDIKSTGNTIIISTDSIHKAGSTTEIDGSETFRPRLQAFQALGEELGGGAVFKPDQHLNTRLQELNEQSTVEWHEKALQSLLYGVENLRKRGGADDSAE